MIKKLKIGLFVAVLSIFGVVSYANAAALTWTANQTITLSSPAINLTILSGSKATSLVVNIGSIAVVVASGDSFYVTSAVRELSVTGNTSSSISKVCTAGTSTVTVVGGSAGETITITPGSGACTSAAADGGVGGGRITPPVIPPVVLDVGCSGGNKYNTSTGALCVNNVGTTAPVLYNFGTTILKNGSKGEAVKELQRFLNATMNLGLIVDGKLGPKTIAVIKKWQKAHALVADGLIGPKTKAKMNASVQ